MPDETNEVETQQDALKNDLRAGVWILFLLTVFTVGEFVAAMISPALGWLLIIAALPKAYFVIMDYMHLPRLYGGDEENH